MIAAPPPPLRARLSLAVSIEVTETEVTAIARRLTTWKNWELSGWGGSLYEELALAGGAVSRPRCDPRRWVAAGRGRDGLQRNARSGSPLRPYEPDGGLRASRTSVFPRVSAICAAVRPNRPGALTFAPASTRAVTAAAFAPTTA